MVVGVPPQEEISPAPQGHERVVFRLHFLHGFGLPVSGFLRSFMDCNHIQPHHLTPNTVTLLSAFAMMCEGYLGILPTIKLWGAFFYTKLGTSAREKAAQCGAFVAVRRLSVKNAFPAIKLSRSVKLWQKSYFYMENIDPALDFINLPPYEAGHLAEPQANWGYKSKPLSAPRRPTCWSPSSSAALLRLLRPATAALRAPLLLLPPAAAPSPSFLRRRASSGSKSSFDPDLVRPVDFLVLVFSSKSGNFSACAPV